MHVKKSLSLDHFTGGHYQSFKEEMAFVFQKFHQKIKE